jgi:pimeloyl-ACP methyl ester carboxylesterase
MPASLLTLAAVLLVAGLVLSAFVIWLMARSLLRPPRMTDGKAVWVLKRLSPGDLGLQFEDVSFDVRDPRSGAPLSIKGWWIPAAGGGGAENLESSSRCVVLLHGYADAKVGAIAWAPVWHSLGFNILALDLRAHGESGGTESTAGYFERHDVEQVIGQLRAERPGQTRQVVLFGISLGAAVAAAAAALDSQAGSGAVSAVVMESPMADFASATRVHMDALGVPGPPFQAAALRLAQWLSGARFDEVRPARTLPAVRCPVFVIAPVTDPFFTPADADAVQAALDSRPDGSGVARIWRVEGADHLLAVQSDPDGYRQALQAFLAEALDASQATQIPHDRSSFVRGAG